jgi:hypothetical protein
MISIESLLVSVLVPLAVKHTTIRQIIKKGVRIFICPKIRKQKESNEIKKGAIKPLFVNTIN